MVDAVSLIVLGLVLIIGAAAVRAFRESKRAVAESATLLSVIVSALSSKLEASEVMLDDLRSKLGGVSRRASELEQDQGELGSNYARLLRYIEEVSSNHRRLIAELDELKRKISSLPTLERRPALLAEPLGAQSGRSIVDSLAPTERDVVEVLLREGPKTAPDLGKRLEKTREHMARLMKKLYLEGYVDRDSNYAPFRYKLNEKVESVFRGGLAKTTALGKATV